MIARTLTAIRQALFTQLTVPQLSYTVNNGTVQTIPTTSIQPQAPWNLGDAPAADPLICFDVTGRGIISQKMPDRHLQLRIWVSASTDSDTITDIYEAIRARLSPDTDNGEGVVSWSRPANAGTGSLATTIRVCREDHVLPAAVEPKTIRWWLNAEWTLYAI